LVVRKNPIKGYDIIAGERRFRAAKEAGLKTVPVVVREFTDQQMMEIALIENIQREDLNPIELANAFKALMEELNITQEELADRVGKSRSHVANYLRLLQLPDDIQEDVSRGTISMGHARAIIGLKDVELQRKIVEKIKNENLSVRQVEELVNQLGTGQEKKEKKQAKKENVPPLIKRYEELLQEVFSTSVKIRHGNKNGKVKGKIEIEYYSERELDRLIEMLNQNRVIL
jgi:ParB family chromosome partitioning protein